MYIYRPTYTYILYFYALFVYEIKNSFILQYLPISLIVRLPALTRKIH